MHVEYRDCFWLHDGVVTMIGDGESIALSDGCLDERTVASTWEKIVDDWVHAFLIGQDNPIPGVASVPNRGPHDNTPLANGYTTRQRKLFKEHRQLFSVQGAQQNSKPRSSSQEVSSAKVVRGRSTFIMACYYCQLWIGTELSFTLHIASLS